MSDEIKLSQLINDVLRDNHLTESMNETKSIAAWHKVVGTYVSSQTEKVCVRNGIMYVNVSNNTLRQELHFQRSKICYAINGELKKYLITEVVVR